MGHNILSVACARGNLDCCPTGRRPGEAARAATGDDSAKTFCENAGGFSGEVSKNTPLPATRAEPRACVPPIRSAVESVESTGISPYSGGDNDTPPPPVPRSLDLLAKVGGDDDPYGPGGDWEKVGKIKTRCVFVTQQTFHPAVGALLTREKIADALDGMGQHKHAFILHDRDVYSEVDPDTPTDLIGTAKPEHFHVAIMFENATTLGTVARRFGIAPNYVQAKPKRAFADLCEYLTHEHPGQQDKGKALYDDSEVTANFDFRQLIEERQEERLKKENRSKTFDDICEMVLSGAKRPRDIQREYPREYAKKGVPAHLQRLRSDYLAAADPPRHVMTYLIHGLAGHGKSVMAMGLARSLFPDSDDPFFVIGGKNVRLDGYDGQPVVILDDFRALDMYDLAGDRGGVFRMLDPHRQPGQRSVFNKKYGSVNLLNSVFIITTPQNHIDFLDSLSGEYAYVDRYGREVSQTAENKGQSYRRIPIIIPIRAEDFDILINKGIADGTDNFFEYYEHLKLRQNLKALHQRCGAITDAAKRAEVIATVESKTVAPIIECARALVSADSATVGDAEVDDILAEFQDVGAPTPSPPPPPLASYSDSAHVLIADAALQWQSWFDWDDDRQIYCLPGAPRLSAECQVHIGALHELGSDPSTDTVIREVTRFFMHGINLYGSRRHRYIHPDIESLANSWQTTVVGATGPYTNPRSAALAFYSTPKTALMTVAGFLAADPPSDPRSGVTFEMSESLGGIHTVLPGDTYTATPTTN